MLSDDVDLLPRLLLPLAGPEEYDDDDVERLPDDLQYLPPDKEREPNPRIRKMLVEALLQVLKYNLKMSELDTYPCPEKICLCLMPVKIKY